MNLFDQASDLLVKHMRAIAVKHNVAGLNCDADVVESGREWDFWMEAAHAAVAEALAATGTQQVGEVQGDAHVLVLREMRARLTDAGSPARTSALDAAIAALAARQPVRIYGCCAQPEGELHTAECPNMRHIAARQPGAQVRDLVPQEVVSAISAVAVIASKESQHPVQKYVDAINAWLNAAPPAQGIDLGTGIKAIAAERERQLQVEGFSRDGDQQYRRGELAKAATAYVQLAAQDLAAGTRDHIAWHGPHPVWPWAPEWWKPVDARRDLVRAGALIAAQIDLIDSQRDAAPGVGNG